MNENSLMRLGIIHPEHRCVETEECYLVILSVTRCRCRQFIWREIAKLRLRTSILYLRDQERTTTTQQPAAQQF